MAVLALAFLAVAGLKGIRSRGFAETDSREAAPRQKTREFWSHYRAASEARMRGDLALAAAAYQDALRIRPQHEDSLYYLGNCLFELGRFDEALEAYQRLVAADPTGSSRGYVRIGLVHACLGREPRCDLGRAEAAFRQALALDPDSGALLGLAELALLRGQWQRARDLLEEENRANTMSVAAPFLLGYLRWKEGDARGAWTWFREAVRRCEVRKPPVPWSEEGDVKASPELRWRALASQSVLGEHWLRVRRLAGEAGLTTAAMEEEYRRLRAALGRAP